MVESTHDEPVIGVHAEVTQEVPAEIATVAVTVRARDRNRPEALLRLTQRAEAVRAMLDAHGEAIERRETAGVVVRPERKGSGERVSAYDASVTTTVTVRDFSVLGDLMLRLADSDQVAVAGPWWALRPDSPVYRQARQAAVAEALSRARDYADALGARVVALISLSDSGMATYHSDAGRAEMRLTLAGSAGGYATPPLDLDPAVQRVQVGVEARFRISEPAALGHRD